tara:strand:- start:423 stop:530 length:108 start_codon:yes stop_codon:yes gene_type:complete
MDPRTIDAVVDPLVTLPLLDELEQAAPPAASALLE